MTTTVTRQGVRAEHVTVPFAGDADDLTGNAARLSFDNGLSRLDLRADADLDQLLDARFSDPAPTVWAADSSVHVEYPLGSRLLRRMGQNAVRISPRLPWSVDVHGGAAHLDADLTGVDLRFFAAHSGMAHARLALGRPAGTTTIRLDSVKDLRIERPGDVPMRVEIAKGATKVTLDDRHFGAIGSGLTDQTSGYTDADARYLVIVSGGADTLSITRKERS
jgi:hypothetical protein